MTSSTSEEMKEKRDSLQAVVGERPHIDVGVFQNWSRTQSRSEILSVSPQSLSEIQAVVRGCRELAIRVRAAGATHSWSPMFSDEGQLVMFTKDLKREKGEPPIKLIQNGADKFVNVMTNVTTGELLRFQVDHNVCLPCNVILQAVTCGGIVAPICHGVGKDCKTISDYVTAMNIVDSKGDLRQYTIDNDAMMKAVQGSLGLFGIIHDITFRVEGIVKVGVTNIYQTVDKVFYDQSYAKQLMLNNSSVEIFWFPFNSLGIMDHLTLWKPFRWNPMHDEVWVRVVNKADCMEEAQIPITVDIQNIFNKIEQKLGGSVIDHIKSNRMGPIICSYMAHLLREQYPPRSKPKVMLQPHAVHYRKHVEEVHVYDMEWAIECDSEFKNFRAATTFVIENVKKWQMEGKFPINVAMEMRLMGSSDVYLSPARNGSSGLTLYIEILSFVETPGWDDCMKVIGEYWMSLPGARPHWAKQFTTVPGVKEHIRKMYNDQIPCFLDQLRKSDADPDGIFFNSTLEELLLQEGHKRGRQVQSNL